MEEQIVMTEEEPRICETKEEKNIQKLGKCLIDFLKKHEKVKT